MNSRVEILNEIVKSSGRLKDGERGSRQSILELTLDCTSGSFSAHISIQSSHGNSGIGHPSGFIQDAEGTTRKNARGFKRGTGFINNMAAREDAQPEIGELRLDIFVVISGLAVIICSLASDMLSSLLEEMLDPAFYTILTVILLIVGASLTVVALWLECREE